MHEFPVSVRSTVLFILLFTPFLQSQIVNDECAGAVTITALPYQIRQDTRLASQNNSDPVLFCQDSAKNGKTVWFKYLADTTRTVVFSTLGSEPLEDYDIVLALFSGTCGDLTILDCNDDTMDVRQSMIGYRVVAGTTYYLMVGEWGGGGPLGGSPTGGDLVLTVSELILPPLVRGPKQGSLTTGMTTTTDNFSATTEIPFSRPKLRKPNVNKRVAKLPPPAKMIEPTGPYGSNFYSDRSIVSGNDRVLSTISRPVALQSFEGIPQTNYIPPDPILAVGPGHVMVAVNSTFRIFDKSGNILKTIDADLWYDQVVPGASTFDPIVMYDHFDQRWIMEMLHVDDAKKTAVVFLSVSDDNNPLGTWYNWALPAHLLGDSAVSNWTDYARVGFDKDAIYITGNQFGFTSNFAYSKLRVIPKSQLYKNTGRGIEWYDFWDFRDPDNVENVIFGLRPSISFGTSDKQFLLNDSPYFLGTFFTLWTLDSVLTAPTISGSNVPVVQYFPSPDAGQRDGSPMPIEAFGADIRNEPVYRDSALWAVHAVASGPEKQYSSVRYVKIDPFRKKTMEDISFGADGYWHSYPALMINAAGDMTLTYSRSGFDEYIGAFMSGRKKDDPPGLAPSITIREGRGNYVVDFGSGRNRWGDYSGIGLDPSDGTSIWTHTEFAAAKNKWGTWVTRTQMGPVAGSKLTANRSSINFGTKNVGTNSDTVTILLTNDGTDSLILSALTTATPVFTIVEPKLLPVVIPSLGTTSVKVTFAPVASGAVTDSILYCASQNCITLTTLATLSGTGFQIAPAEPGIMYASSGSADGGKLYSVNTSTGVPTFLAHSGLGQVTSLRVHPKTKELIGLDPTGSIDGGALYRLSTSGNSLIRMSSVMITNLKGLAFINDTMAYMTDFNGRIFRVNVNTGAFTQIASTGLRISGVALNPIDGALWFSVRATSGAVDALYRYQPSSQSAVKVGTTGLAIANADLLFDKNGALYVLAGVGTVNNKLVEVDTATGTARKILDLGMSNITAIALNPDAVAGMNGWIPVVPEEFCLNQNYPNPFNPLTVIGYSLPVATMVTMIVYDDVGRIVQTLAQGIRTAGYHKEYFDASGLSSGVYYCHLSAGAYTAVRKMMLIK
jgi:hypothetical protein